MTLLVFLETIIKGITQLFRTLVCTMELKSNGLAGGGCKLQLAILVQTTKKVGRKILLPLVQADLAVGANEVLLLQIQFDSSVFNKFVGVFF